MKKATAGYLSWVNPNTNPFRVKQFPIYITFEDASNTSLPQSLRPEGVPELQPDTSLLILIPLSPVEPHANINLIFFSIVSA